jgi:hypothetical protein
MHSQAVVPFVPPAIIAGLLAVLIALSTLTVFGVIDRAGGDSVARAHTPLVLHHGGGRLVPAAWARH